MERMSSQDTYSAIFEDAHPEYFIDVPSAGIGEYVEGAHWKDKPLAEKVWDIFKVFLKVLAVAVLIAGICFAIKPIVLLAVGVGLAVLVTGLALMAISYYRTCAMCSNPGDPHSLEWSENSVYVTQGTDESIRLKLQLLRNAEHSIELSGNFCGGPLFDQALDIIKERLESKPGLQVKIISSCIFLSKENRRRIRELAERYPARFYLLETQLTPIMLPTFRLIDNHVKLLIVDGIHCMTGGTGLEEVLGRETPAPGVGLFERLVTGQGSRDCDAILTGPLAMQARGEFHKLLAKWNRIMGPKSKHGRLQFGPDRPARMPFMHIPMARAALITGGYEQGRANGCKAAYLRMIRLASRSITMGTMSLNDPDIVRALIRAAKRGVKVTIVSNGNNERGPLGARILGITHRDVFEELTRAGIECFEYYVDGILYHKKVLVIDGQLTAIGSFNANVLSTEVQDEDVILINSRRVARQALEGLSEDQTTRRSMRFQPSRYPLFRRIGRAFAMLTTANLAQ